MKIFFSFIATLCYIINNDKVLLQYKKQGFGKGKWNGPGGKVEKGETIRESVKREMKEETGLNLKNFRKMAELEFIFKDKKEWNNHTYVFVCKKYSGRLKKCEEGDLKWFRFSKIPFKRMWPDDKIWLVSLLRGKKLKMRFYFDKDGELLRYEKI